MTVTDWRRNSTRPDLRPLVVITESNIEMRQARGSDLRGQDYFIDLSIAAGGILHYPVVGSRWYIGKIGDRWVLSSRFGQQNPQLDPSFTPELGETYIGGEGKTVIIGDLEVLGSGGGGNPLDIYPVDSIYLTLSPTFDPNVTFGGTWVTLENSFLVGAGDLYAIAATGGAVSHTLVTDNLPSHNHAVGTLVNAAESSHTHGVGTYANGNQSASHTHTGTSGGQSATHTHQIGRDQDGAGGSIEYILHSAGLSGAESTVNTGNASVDHTHTTTTGNQSASHNHTISGSSAAGSSHNHTISGSTANTGSGTAVDHLPPYLAVFMWRRTT